MQTENRKQKQILYKKTQRKQKYIYTLENGNIRVSSGFSAANNNIYIIYVVIHIWLCVFVVKKDTKA